MNGIRTIPPRFGASDQKPMDQIVLLMSLRVFNSWMKSETRLKLPSNGLLRKVSWVTKTWEESELTSMMLLSTLMLSTEVVVKSSQLLEESSMLAFLHPNQLSKSQSSWSKSKPQMTQLVPSISAWPKEEESLLVKSQLLEPHLFKWKLIYQSVNPSVSLKHLELLLQEELSHNASSIIGKKWLEIHLKKAQRPISWSNLSERERASR